MINNVELLKLK